MKTKALYRRSDLRHPVLAVGGWTGPRRALGGRDVGGCRLRPGRTVPGRTRASHLCARARDQRPHDVRAAPPRRGHLVGGGAIGIAVGAEGAFALFLPLLIGSLSDRTQSRFGRRIPYALVAPPWRRSPSFRSPTATRRRWRSSRSSSSATTSTTRRTRRCSPSLVPATHQGRAQGWQGAEESGLGSASRPSPALPFPQWTPLLFLLAAGRRARHGQAPREAGQDPRAVAAPDVPRSPGQASSGSCASARTMRAFVAMNAL